MSAEEQDRPAVAPDAVLHPAVEALDLLDEGVVSVDRDATILHANRSALAFAGLSVEDVVGRNLFASMPYLRATEFAEHFDRALATGEVQEYETFTPRVGRWLRRRFFPTAHGLTIVVDEGTAARQDGSATDGSDPLRRARAAERRYREILDSMNEGVTETTPDGHFVVVNESFATMLGYASPGELLAHTPTSADLYVLPDVRRTVVDTLSSGGTRTVEAQLRHRDGGSVWIRARVVPRHRADGEIESFRSLVEDITAEREAERRRRDAEAHIEARERAQLAEAIHDEPLQLVVATMLHLDTLRPRLPLAVAEPMDHVVSLLERTVDRLRNLIVALDPPDLRHGLGPAVHALADGIFMGTPTLVEVDGQAQVPLAPDVAGEAYRVLREALVNARKHARARTVTVHLSDDGSSVTLSVVDDGVGGAAPTSAPGHLGLTSMRTRVEGLQGSLRIVSPPGAGTEVTLVLPVRAET